MKILNLFLLHSFSLSSSRGPNFERVVDTSRDQVLALEVDGGHEVIMDVRQLLEAAPVVQVPHSHRLVVAHRYQVLSVQGEHQIVHPVVVTDKSDETTPALSFPQLDSLISRS